MDWQTILAITIALLAGIWAVKLLVLPFIVSMRPDKPGRCPGGCGCGREDRKP